MNDLSPESRALLRRLQEDFEPTGAERSRVDRALSHRLGIAAVALAGTATAATSAAASVAGAGAAAGSSSVAAGAGGSMLLVGAKWLSVALVVGAVGAGGVSAYRVARHTPGRPAAAASPHVQAPGPALSSTPLVPSPPAPPSDPIAPVRAEPPRAAPAHPTTNAPAGTVAEETRLLRSAHTALQSGHAARALALLDEHARTFPDGVLAEERSVERVFALCTLGRVGEAREAARAFLVATPGSPLADSVRRSCALSEGQ
jgi:hypothetical protein